MEASALSDTPEPSMYGTWLVAISLLSGSIILLYTLSSSSNQSHVDFWKRQPIVGVKAQWFSWLRGTLRSIMGTKTMVDDGYKLVCLRSYILTRYNSWYILVLKVEFGVCHAQRRQRTNRGYPAKPN